jgi:hypothetical protein
MQIAGYPHYENVCTGSKRSWTANWSSLQIQTDLLQECCGGRALGPGSYTPQLIVDAIAELVPV